MSPNEVPHGFKVSDIGLIPSDWQALSLADVAHIETGRRMKGGGERAGEVLSLGGEHINPDGSLNLLKPKYVSREFYDGMKGGRLRPRDVLMVKDGATTGKLAFLREVPTGVAATNEHLFVLRGKEGLVDNYFLYTALLSEIGQKQITRSYHGLIGGITKTETLSIVIPVPPIAEQKKIASVLSTVQSAKEKTEAVISALKELKKSLMKHLFTYGPVPLNDTHSALLRHSELGDIPTHWRLLRLYELIQSSIDYRGKTPKKSDKGIPLVTARALKEGRLDYKSIEFISEEEYAKWMTRGFPRNGDVLFTTEAPIGETAILTIEGRVALAQRIVALRAKKEIAINKFLCYALQHEPIRQDVLSRATGTTATGIKKSELMKVTVPIPPLSEQARIVDMLDSIDASTLAETNRVASLSATFVTLLEQLMTGKLRINNLEVPT